MGLRADHLPVRAESPVWLMARDLNSLPQSSSRAVDVGGDFLTFFKQKNQRGVFWAIDRSNRSPPPRL